MGPEPVLVDPGPTSVRPRVVEALREAGVDPSEIRHLCLTHIHLDHAGSAGSWVAEHPGIQVHVHEDAGVHLVDPRRLVASTRITFGEAHDRLWGEVVPVPSHAIRGLRPGERGPFPWLRALHTPGHMEQHMAFLDEDSGTLLAGDSLGIVLAPGAETHPPTPPPTADLAAWLRTLREVEAVAPEAAAVTHFGVHDDVPGRVRGLREGLLGLAERVEGAVNAGTVEEDAEAFHQETVERLAPHRPEGEVARYFKAFSAANDYRGMVRYIERNPQWRKAS